MAQDLDVTQAGDSELFGPAEGGPGKTAASPPRRPLVWGAALALALIAAVTVICVVSIRSEIAKSRAQLAERVDLTLAARGETVAGWQDRIRAQSARLADNESFRLFAAELDAAAGDMARLFLPAPGPGAAPVSDRMPYLTQTLAEFVAEGDASAAYLVGQSGTALVASPSGPPLRSMQAALAKAAMTAGKAQFSPVRVGAKDLELDYALPVMPPQLAAGEARAVGALVVTLPLTRRVQSFLKPGRSAAEAEGHVRLFQAEGGKLVELVPMRDPPLSRTTEAAPAAGAAIAFARRPQLGGGDLAYVAGAPLPELGWWLVYELPAAIAEAQLDTSIAVTVALGALLLAGMLAAGAGLWWRLSADYSRSIAEQYRSLAGRVEHQRRFLDSINGAITDLIGLKDEAGRYVFVNPAFAKAVGRAGDEIKGLDDSALFGHGTALRLKRWDDLVRSSNMPMTVEEDVFIESKLHHLQISKVPFRDPDGHTGVLSVSRDVTAAVTQQRLRERAVKQTITALVRAVELRDPYLAGHSRRMAEIGVAIARALKSPADVVTTVETAANLSQIGKLGIRKELLTKTSRLSPQEVAELQAHITFAGEVLRGIDFDMPVLDTILQMHERLDGSGYPRGLAGADISLAGRILAVSDVFCARIEARSYRPGIDPAEALKVLEQNSTRYDPEVVRALREVIGTVAGEKLIAGAAAA